MDSFGKDLFIRSYTKHNKFFDKWCEKASPVLGNITQCGICEFDSSGHGFLLFNRPDYGEPYVDKKRYLFEKDFHY